MKTIATDFSRISPYTPLKNPSMKSQASLDPTLRTNFGFRFAHNNRERVSSAIKKNAILESSPSEIYKGTTYEKIMNLRPREKEKDLDGEFRFKAKSNAEKVLDHIRYRNPLQSL